MSLINAVRRADCSILISDAVGIDDDALVVSIASKVTIIPALNAVLGIRGNRYLDAG